MLLSITVLPLDIIKTRAIYFDLALFARGL